MTNASRYRLGVDVGGTHTDLVLLDTASGELMVEKVASTPANPALGVLDGVAQVPRPRHRAGGDRLLRPRHHHHHQRAPGDARRQGRALDHQGLPRGAGDPDPGARRQPVRLFLCQAGRPSPRKASPGKSPSAPTTPATSSLPLDQEAVRQAARELKAAGVESIAVCYLFSFMNPRHEEATRAHHRAGISRRARVAVERGPAAHPRMAAALHHPAQRLSRAGDGALHRPPQRRPRPRRRAHAAALPDAVERRRDAVLRRDRRRAHRAHAVLRPRRRRAGERASRPRRGDAAAWSRWTWAAPRPTSPSSKAARRWR